MPLFAAKLNKRLWWVLIIGESKVVQSAVHGVIRLNLSIDTGGEGGIVAPIGDWEVRGW